jgi:hypothetical protein
MARESVPERLERAEELKRQLASDPEQKYVFSVEDYATGHLKKDFEGSPLRTFPDQYELAGLLRSCFGDAKVIVVLRSQAELLESFYIQFSRGHIPVREVDVNKWFRAQRQKGEESFLNCFNFDRLLDCYSELFGQKNVMPLTYEEFKQSPQDFVQRIASFMEIDSELAWHNVKFQNHENRRVSSASWQLMLFSEKHKRLISAIRRLVPRHVTKSVLNFTNRLSSPVRQRLHSESKEMLAEIYGTGNRKVEEEWQLPLERYGYP